MSESVPPMFSSKSFMVSGLIIHLDFNLCIVLRGSNIILFHASVQAWQVCQIYVAEGDVIEFV